MHPKLNDPSSSETLQTTCWFRFVFITTTCLASQTAGAMCRPDVLCCAVGVGSYDPADILRCAMPRGSELLFTGGLMDGSGENETDAGRKSLLSSYQLGWLRPE